MSGDNSEPLMTIVQAAKKLGVSQKAVRRLIKAEKRATDPRVLTQRQGLLLSEIAVVQAPELAAGWCDQQIEITAVKELQRLRS